MEEELHNLVEAIGGLPQPDLEIWSLYWEARSRLRLLALDAYHRAVAQAIAQGYELGDTNDAFKHVSQDLAGPMSSFTQFLNIENLD